METRQLGRSGLYVSELALGAMTFGAEGWGCDEQTATELIHRYLDAGGNVIDTANIYGPSEDILGRALQGKRSDVVLSTKVGLPAGAGPHQRGASRIHIKAACESSLRRLQTDHIDLYHLHADDPATPLDETLEALDDLVREGKVLYLGASNYRAYRLMKALGISDRSGLTRFVAYQGQYNLIVRGAERELFGLLDDEGLGYISWSPLGAGMLTGKLQPGVETDDTRLGQRSYEMDSLYKNDRGFEIAAAVQKAATEIGCSPAQLALAWQRTRPVTSVIIGVRTMKQLEDNLASLDVDIPPEVLDELDRFTEPSSEYPGTFVDIIQQLVRGGRRSLAVE